MNTIVEVTSTMDRGGAEMMLMDLVRRLYQDFRFVFLINRKKGTCPEGDFDQELKSMSIPIYFIDAVWDVGVKEYQRQFRAIMDEIGPVDVIHSHLNSKGGIISKCAAQCNIPKRIVHCHAKIRFDGSMALKAANYAELILQRLWINKYATDYWGCSEDALPSLFTKKHCHSEKTQVIHNAIDLCSFSRYTGQTVRDELSIPKSELVFGTVGRIARVKDYELAADVISALWERGINCHYVVAGRKQSEQSVQYLFDKLGKDARFHYLGVRDNLPAIYRGLDLYIGTSLREGLGLTAVEAQASGTLCVLSGGFPKLCDVGAELVSFVDGRDATQWENVISELLSQKQSVDMDKVEVAVRASGFDVAAEAERVKRLYNA